MNAEKILVAAYPSELVTALLTAYREIESNYAVRKWKASELDAGHFVEAARRIIDQVLTGSYLAIGKTLSSFSDAELKRLEQLHGDESFRILIPRVLKSVYNLRNKRGVGHLGAVSPNEMDATLIIYSVKWVLGELVRLASGSAGDPASAQYAVNQIMERRLELIWKSGDTVRILHSKLSAREQTLVLLYDKNLQTADVLRNAIEYKNPANYRLILKRLHDDRFIEWAGMGEAIAITPRGVILAEQIIAKHSSSTNTISTSAKGRKKSRAKK